MEAVQKYCTGCGFCKHGFIDENGFFKPIADEKDNDFSICPYYSMPKQVDSYINEKSILGPYLNSYWGFSNEKDIRQKASTGGTITSILLYMLENKIVDKILQIGENHDSPLETAPMFCGLKNEIINNRGSKYCPTQLLSDLRSILDTNLNYAVVAKPCDAIILRNLMKTDKRYGQRIKVIITFFCGGTSSIQATKKMVQDLGVEICDIKTIKYRGDGWPGKVQIKTKKNEVIDVEYEDAWQKYLGRNMMDLCRICWDGLGNAGDITCGDGWYTVDKKPDFTEHEGRNVVIARTERGEHILRGAQSKNYITLLPFSKMDFLNFKYMQPGQYDKKCTMFAKILVMKIFRKKVPDYNLKQLYSYAKLLTIKKNIRTLLGTIKRILEGKI